MTWVRLDDNWLHHPKFADVGDHGRLLWVSALTLSNNCLTDGRVTDRQVSSLLQSKRYLSRALQELVTAGLFVRVEGGYQIHDYEHYQPLASAVKANREATRERVKRWRERQCNSVTNGVTNAVSTPLVTPTRVRARAWDGISLSDPEGVQGEGTAESGYDLAWRLWSELWQAKHGTAYQRTIDQGQRGDDRILQRIGALASKCPDPEATLRRKLVQFFDDDNPWLERNRHPLRFFESDWNKYDSEPTIAQAAPPVVDRPMTDEECAAARKRLDEQNAQRAIEREKRAQINAELERALAGMKKP